MLRNLRHLWRLIGIARCLARHNALFPLERLPLPDLVLRLVRRWSREDAAGRPGQRLALALQDLGPSFIKLGQSLICSGRRWPPTSRSCRTTCRRSTARSPAR